MRRILLGTSALVLFLAPAASFAQHQLSELTLELEALRQRYRAPGLAVAVVFRDRVLLSEGFGFRDVGQELPVTQDTVFALGSVTKSFTAALIGVSADQGLLSLDDQPLRHIPELRFATTAMDQTVTLADLLAHKSGLGGVDGTHVFFPLDDRVQHLQRLRNLPPASAVRTRFDYSNMGYAILGEVIERVSGRTWEGALVETLFRPLGMESSSASLGGLATSEQPAKGYGMLGEEAFEVLLEDQHESGPSGAINSSVSDLSKWIRMLLALGRFEGQALLSEEFLAESFSAQIPIRSSFDPISRGLTLDAYGFGWFVNDFEGRYRVNHGGNVPGFSARIDLLPGEALGVAVLCNQQSSELPVHVADLVFRHVLDLERLDPSSYPVRVAEAHPNVDPQARAPSTEAGLNAERPPTHALLDYVGAYRNPGYGTFEVRLQGPHLLIDFPAFSFELEHLHHDVFRLRPFEDLHQNTPRLPVRFSSNFDGIVDGASIPFAAEPPLFLKSE